MKVYYLLLILVLFTGCMNKFYAFDFNASSDADCSVKCETLMNENNCWEASPSYSSSFTNQVQTSGLCSCYVRTCRGK
jgi:hypothetical protein